MRDDRGQPDRRRYEAVYTDSYADLVRFVARRGYPPDEAEDVVAEAFVVAWQRLNDLPAEPAEARAWLFGITRRLLLARRRAHSRTQELSIRMAEQVTADGPARPHDNLVATAVDLARAWNELSAAHQEALSLSIWDKLTGAQAAHVLGISPVAFRIRVSRARRHLKHRLEPRSDATAVAVREEGYVR